MIGWILWTAWAGSADLHFEPVAAVGPRMSLTAADGTGLVLRKMVVQAVVEQPLAYTELHLTFDNPENRQIEGRFEITLPEGAAVSRFAMKLDDRWQEGEVVEKQAARRAYEDFLHRRTDPALLEYEAGNEFRARVFPIPAKGSKELIISWSHDLDEGEAWTLPTGGLPQLGLLEATVSAGGQSFRHVAEYAVPEGDLALVMDPTGPLAMRSEATSVFRFQPELSVGKDPVRDAVVLVDTSASRALSFEALLEDVYRLVQTFDGKVEILAFDQEIVPIWKGRARSIRPADLRVMKQRGALGASDPAAAFARVAGAERVVLFSDGVRTAGDDDVEKILKSGRFGRVDAVLRGGARDELALQQWVRGHDREGVVLDVDAMGREEAARRLGLGTAGVTEVSVPGAEWVWPNTLRGLQPGDTVTVYADLPRSTPASVALDGKAVTGWASVPTAGPLLARQSAQAEISALMDRKSQAKGEEAVGITERIVKVSTANRVLSPHTALLVLETEADYERFGIPRQALADVLVVRQGELSWLKRVDPVVGVGGPAKAPKDESRDAVGEDVGERQKEKRVQAEPAEASMENKSDLSRYRPTESEVIDAVDQDPAMKASEEEAAPSPIASPARSAPAPRAERTIRQARDESLESVSERFSSGGTPPAPPPPPAEVFVQPAIEDAWEGDFRTAMQLVIAGKWVEAEVFCEAWRARAPGDPLAFLALGEVLEARGELQEAARVYGSLIDLFPSRADLRRLAGERLERLGEPGHALAIDTYEEAVAQRPDHPSGHRNLAWALVAAGRHREAIEVIRKALPLPFERFEAAHSILREDAGIIASAWKRAEPQANVAGALDGLGATMPNKAGLRFVLNWETDANDVDFHIYDGKNGHAYYSDRELPSGGRLYADITSGYGPECFAIDRPSAFPYTLQAHYYSRGPMGFGMGKLQVIEHDGKGKVNIDNRPFVVMKDGAYVDLGKVERSTFR